MNIILPEIVTIGIYNSNLSAKNQAITKSRRTKHFEIELPIENGGTSYIDNTSHPIVPDLIICSRPNQVRHTKTPYKCYYIHFMLADGELYRILNTLPNYINLKSNEKYNKIFKQLTEYYDYSTDNSEIILQGLLLQLIYMLQKEGAFSVALHGISNSNIEAINDTIKYINNNLTADLSLETLSKRAGFSKIHFHNTFKTATAKTLRIFVEEQRIKKAAQLLISTKKTLTEITYECGFSSQSYFSYAFKRKMGLTPRQYATQVFKRYEEL
ncbi:MAG: helix-turn-helix transcriptional regulator [Clostridia bacterium]|nr:helix-turn-helix transcriptional regulator [Clostridia bacterium]